MYAQKTPVQLLIRIYLSAHSKDVYINNFEGFKLLYEWLKFENTNIDRNSIDLPPASFRFRYSRYSKLIGSYEIQELARILELRQDVLAWHIFKEINADMNRQLEIELDRSV